VGLANRRSEKGSSPEVCERVQESGRTCGEEWAHAHSEITERSLSRGGSSTNCVPRASGSRKKSECVFCDIVRQEEKKGKRIVDVQGDYYALCPYASRVPFEIWLLHRRHNHLFEQPKAGSDRRQLAALLGRVLRRLEKVTPAYQYGGSHCAQHSEQEGASLPATGKLWPMIFTGTSKFFRSSRPRASPTASRKLTSMPYCLSRQRSSFAG